MDSTVAKGEYGMFCSTISFVKDGDGYQALKVSNFKQWCCEDFPSRNESHVYEFSWLRIWWEGAAGRLMFIASVKLGMRSCGLTSVWDYDLTGIRTEQMKGKSSAFN